MINHKNRTITGGFTLIEVLVTLLIIAIGLLGLAGLQVNSLKAQLEAYQRAQALLLAEEMVNRVRVNAIEARGGAYTEGTEYGVMDRDDICPADPNSVTTAVNDLCAWHDALTGTGVVLSGDNLGSIVGARGCIDNIPGSLDQERIIRFTIAWLGTSPRTRELANPVPAGYDCGENQYGDDDRYRRTLSIDAVLANLTLVPSP